MLLLKENKNLNVIIMRKNLIRIFIGLGVVLIALLLISGWYMFKVNTLLKTMTPLETKQVINNIYSVNNSFVNLYLLKDSSQYIAVDAGNDIETVSTEMAKLNIDPNKVKAVLLTHSDSDHAAALKLFKNAKVYLSYPEEKLINGEENRFFLFGNKIDTEDYILLKDQEELQIGNFHIKCFLNSGHTPGSMSYVVNDKYLFIGDALSLKEGLVQEFIHFFNMDSEKAKESINLLSHISGVEYIFTAHFGFSDDYKTAFKNWK
ncbi:MBL fold metallo-hydrolase [Labilibacter sediminis]|nr:MBL fold metallo-hydrolase [Labilibacter sediminis]